MNLISQHKILLHGESYVHCSEQVRKFFDLTSLVIYDCIEIRREQSYSAIDPTFWQELTTATDKNHDAVTELLNELQHNNIDSLKDIGTIKQGYVSKVFHILSHFLDGFIGIDSSFYNLLDDSHWLPVPTANSIRQNPEEYWLLHIDGFAASPEEVGLFHK